jgi:hypothetical protein
MANGDFPGKASCSSLTHNHVSPGWAQAYAVAYNDRHERSARQIPAADLYAALLSGVTGVPATVAPAIATASVGFRLSTIAVGISMVAPRSLVVS